MTEGSFPGNVALHDVANIINEKGYPFTGKRCIARRCKWSHMKERQPANAGASLFRFFHLRDPCPLKNKKKL